MSADQYLTRTIAADLAARLRAEDDMIGTRTNLRVLIVSLDVAMRQLVQSAFDYLEQQHKTDSGDVLAVDRVDDFLMALGEVAISGAPHVLIAGVETIDEDVLSSVASLRRLAPQTRLMLLAPGGEKVRIDAAIRAGFDEYLSLPTTPEQLAHVLSYELSRPGGVKNPIDEPSLQPELFAASPVTGGNGSDAVPAAPPPHELGDVDLIDRMLQCREGIREIALRLIREQGGIAALGWCDDVSQSPRGHIAVAVIYEGSTLGVLHAPPPATQATLESWAQWLSRWLALDQRLRQLWDMAVRDELTGVWNRRYFNRFLKTILARAQTERFRVTVMVFDIDDFKSYNDRYGHAAGDEILRETARLMNSVVRSHDVVARIGGDEFGVIFWDAEGPRRPNSSHPNDVRAAAERFQRAICSHKFPKLLQDAPGTLTISGGLAGFPWDGRTPDELVQLADEMALKSKRSGKNALTFGHGASQACSILTAPSDPGNL